MSSPLGLQARHCARQIGLRSLKLPLHPLQLLLCLRLPLLPVSLLPEQERERVGVLLDLVQLRLRCEELLLPQTKGKAGLGEGGGELDERLRSETEMVDE